MLAAPPSSDPRVQERQRRIDRLLAAEGRTAVSRAADELLQAGFELPASQEVQLQLLEHVDEERVRAAMAALAALFAVEPARRRAVLESRLRRIEELAEEESTRSAAERLRRMVSGRPRGADDA